MPDDTKLAKLHGGGVLPQGRLTPVFPIYIYIYIYISGFSPEKMESPKILLGYFQIERRRRERERGRREAHLGGPGGMPPRKIFEMRCSQMNFEAI